MSVKSLPPSTPSTTRRADATPVPVKADKPNLLERLGQGLQQIAQGAAQGADRLVDRFEAINPLKKPVSLQKPWDGITLTGKPLQIPLEALRKVDLGDVRKVLEKVFPPKVNDAEGKKLVAQTQPFRDTLSKVRALGAELDMLPPSHPRHAEVKAALGRAEADLKAQTGYTRATAPRPGALWLDPQFLAKELPGGQVHASRFPTGTPVTRPPSPTDFLFGSQPRPLTLGEGPTARTVRNAEEYKAAVAARRAELGMPVKDGEPVGVHMSLEGGGGKGKRYAAMIAEMYELGVVPTSLSGSSAGAIAASFAATGASPQQMSDVAKDPRLAQLYDIDLRPDDGGVMNGNAAFEFIDSKLRELTGIKDRPVTFADLKMPLQLIAAKSYDSAMGPDGFKSAKDRIFVFSQETTPDTPVALAVRASMAIPGAFDPVQMVDPTTGRTMHLVDGGALDNLPIGYNKNNLPTVGVSLYDRASNHPQAADNIATPKPLPTGNVDSSHILWNAFNGYTFMKDSASGAADFRDRTAPQANQFMLSVPTWDLNDPSRENTTLGFGYDAKVDPTLDAQTRQVTQNFLRNYIDDLRVPGSRGTNVTTEVPKDLRFSVPVTVKGERYQVSYAGGDSVVAVSASGKRTELKLGQQKIEAMYLDHLAFGDLSGQLGHAISNPRSLKPSWLPF